MHDKDKTKETERVPSLSELEADVAYFDARLSLLGKPTTYYQKTQEVVYRMLEGMLIQRLIEKRGNELKKTTEKHPNKSKKKS